MSPQTHLLLLQLLSALLLSSSRPVSANLQCLDADGTLLDWFAVLKQPDGRMFSYVSSKQPNSWIQPESSDIGTSGPVLTTLNQIFAGSSAAASPDVLAAYNDEPPPGASAASSSSGQFGHLKGVVALTAGQPGFWLIHSVPKFPDLSSTEYIYPDTGVRYGQSFLCITVNSSTVAGAIGAQLFATHPQLYRIDVSQDALARWPSWADVKRGSQPPAQLLNSTALLATADGLPVMHVAKSAHMVADLYDHLVARELQSSIQVESWIHGKFLLNSTCTRPYNVTKVLRVRIGGLPEFKSTGDHSKWCVSTDAGKQWVCIGDMNRAETQFRRGGGTACISLPGLHRLFKAAVISDQACGGGVGGDGGGDVDDIDDDKAAVDLLSLFNWVLAAVGCAIVGTAAAATLVLWFALGGGGGGDGCCSRGYTVL